jgi:molybdate transport system substrate-binding protein
MKPVTKTSLFFILIVGLLLSITSFSGCTGDSSGDTVELNISAAASLTDALQELNELYMEKNKNVTLTTNFSSSGTLQKQIGRGLRPTSTSPPPPNR